MAQQLRTQTTLKEGWRFMKEGQSEWQNVTVPHDWAIYGPFDRENDIQRVAVVQNGERHPSDKTGRTGGLPYMGKGYYELTLHIDSVSDNRALTLLFDGAMSQARVLLNGKEVGYWPYGYNSFSCDITAAAQEGDNTLRVELENMPQSSRWYPGAGLYRNVHLISTDKVHIPVWGTYITTPYVSDDYASVHLRAEVEGAANGTQVRLVTRIRDAAGREVAMKDNTQKLNHGKPAEQHFTVEHPHLWSPETPTLYTAETELYYDGRLVDRYTTRFGIRTVELRADKGIFLNGKMRKFRGVCLHHDLGPLGAAVNKAALRRQLTMLKDMGCDAIRTSHNMPDPQLVALCDEMGFMMMVESFDEWNEAKCENGYHRFFDEWAERDMVNMLHNFRNNPSVVMWSIGNEVPSQWSAEGYKVATWLRDICYREDPTRPVTCGMNDYNSVVNNGFAALFDVAGFNYKVPQYPEAYAKLPQCLVLGSETASTVSSRGVYHFPVKRGAHIMHDDHQSTGYDVEYCSWSNIPDDDFAADDDLDYMIGQFVWTGFDYLGEPTPYDTDAWPNHSSMFGIIDLASIPKDRYWLYRSVWNNSSPTLHILPHWNWEGREGETTPVYVYTSYPSAELFVNGKSQGMRHKNDSTTLTRYRLMWDDVRYEPGELRVVAYDAQGAAVAEKSIRTAGKAYGIELTPDRRWIAADGEDLSYINVRIVDKEGNPLPTDSREIRFKVSGAGSFRAVANGDPTSLEAFHEPHMHLFSGQLTCIVQSTRQEGTIKVEAMADGVKAAECFIRVE
ncbi:MAG: DUF4982 domain-containing protein [Alistipes sp.]|nr:DUF4982 domain-containing protein [Alistipes sp.]